MHGLRNAFDSIGWRRDQMSRIQSVQPFQQGCVTALVASCGVSSTADRSLTRVVEELVDKCFPVAQDLLKAQPCCRGFLSLQGEVDKATRMHRIAVKIVELARSCVARSQEACAMPQWSDVACAINDCLDSCTQLEASSSAHTSSFFATVTRYMKLFHPHHVYTKYGYSIANSLAANLHSEFIGVEIRPPPELQRRPRFLSPDVLEFPFWTKACSASSLAVHIAEGRGLAAVEKGDPALADRACLRRRCPEIYKLAARNSLPIELQVSWCRRRNVVEWAKLRGIHAYLAPEIVGDTA